MKGVTDLKAHLAVLFANLIYGANYAIAKLVMPTYMQPSGFIFLRVSFALIAFQITYFFFKPEPLPWKVHLRLILCGITGVAVNQLLFFEGLNLTTPIHASLIMTVNPILVLILASIMIGERITPLKSMGVVLGLAGAAWLITRAATGNSIHEASLLGDIFIFLNAMSYGFYLVLVKPLMHQYRAVTIIKWVFFYGFIFVFPFGIESFLAADWASMPFNIWMAIIYVVLGTTYLAYLLNTLALRKLEPGTVSFYVYLQPLFAAIVAISLGQDSIGWHHLGSAVLIFAGVFLVSKKFAPK